MSLIVFALVAFIVAALCVYALQIISPDARLTQIGTLVIIVIALLAILNRGGFV